MKKHQYYILGFMLISLSTSCYYDELYTPELPDIPVDQIVSFSGDIQPIFTQSGKDCTACHNGSIASPDLREGNSYNALLPDYVVPGNAEASELFQKLPGNDHPIEAGFILNSDEIALIGTWIDRGAENN
jgi:hypothetical protein